MRKLRAAVVGLGVGEQHAKALAELPDCEVAWLCDLDIRKLERCAKSYPGAKVTKEAKEALADPDVDLAVIASYDSDHCDQTVTALNNDKHVFVEKPLCQTREELDRVVATLKRHPDRLILSNLILRRSPRLLALKAAIDRAKLGELFYIEADYAYGRLHKITDGWRGQLPFYSVTTGGGIHMIDVLLWLTGKRVVEVQAYGNRIATRDTKFRFDDFQVALLKFEDDTIGKVSSNFACVHPHHHLLEVYGTEGTFVQNALGAAYISSRDPGAPVQQANESHPGAAKGDFILDFVRCIQTGARPEISPDEIIEPMRICVAIEQAIQQRRPVRLAEVGG